MKWYESPIVGNIIALFTFLVGLIVTVWFNKRMLAIEKSRDRESEIKKLSASISFEVAEGSERQRIIRIKNDGEHYAEIQSVLFDDNPFAEHSFVIDKFLKLHRIESRSSFEIPVYPNKNWGLNKITVKYNDGTQQVKEATQSLNL